jgi:hypothetical protein
LKRAIRLKEMEPGTSRLLTPSELQHEVSDLSLTPGSYPCNADEYGFLSTGNVGFTNDPPIVFMGGSFVESAFSTEEDRFVSQVERKLAARGARHQCLNAGYSGSSTLHLYNSLLNKVYPHVGPGGKVVFFVPHSDRDSMYRPGSYWNGTKRGATILPEREPKASAAIPDGVASTAALLRIVAHTSRQLGLDLVFVTCPFRNASFDTDAVLRRTYRRNRQAFNQSLQRRKELCEVARMVGAETGTRVIDGEHFLDQKPECFYDELHLNREGQGIFSDFLTTAILG